MEFIRSNFGALAFLLLLLAFTAKGQTILDVTKNGAAPNTDITKAVTTTWAEACASTTPSKVLIPKGIYQLTETILEGPCKSSIEVQIEGTLQAHPDPVGEGMVLFRNVDLLTVSGTGVLDGQGQKGWEKNNCHEQKICTKLPMNLKLSFITNAIVKDITSLDSKNFHINLLGCKNLTFQHLTITAPDESPNTDGIHISSSEEISVLDTKIGTGDDCISVGDSNKQITITNVTCGPGHGISIGSLGKYTKEKEVVGVFVKQCKITGTSNGVRIKSWPDSAVAFPATNMHFEDIEMDNVTNPILIDQEYCPWNQCNRLVPSKIKISNVTFKNIRGTSASPVAVKFICSKSLPCEGVELADIDLTYSGSEGSITSECSNIKPIVIGKQSPIICAGSASANGSMGAALAPGAAGAALAPGAAGAALAPGAVGAALAPGAVGAALAPGAVGAALAPGAAGAALAYSSAGAAGATPAAAGAPGVTPAAAGAPGATPAAAGAAGATPAAAGAAGATPAAAGAAGATPAAAGAAGATPAAAGAAGATPAAAGAAGATPAAAGAAGATPAAAGAAGATPAAAGAAGAIPAAAGAAGAAGAATTP